MANRLSNCGVSSPLLHIFDFHDVSRGFNPASSSALHFRLRGSRAKSLILSRYKDVEKSYASSVNCLDISQEDGRYLLSGGGDGSVVIFGLNKPSTTVQQTFPVLGKIPPNSKQSHQFALSACQFYPADPGVFTTSCQGGVLKIWDTHQMKAVHQFAFGCKMLDHNMSSLKSAKPLIAISGFGTSTRICDLRTVTSIQSLPGDGKPITSVRWSRHTPTILATGSSSGAIALWDIRKAKSCLGYLDAENSSTSGRNASSNRAHNGAVISLEFAEDANHLVSYGSDSRLRLWSTVSMSNTLVNYGKVPYDFREKARHLQMSVSRMTRPDLIFIPTEDKIVIYDMFSGVRIGSLSEHFGQVLTCAYHPSFQLLFSGGNDRNILTWAPLTDNQEYEEEVESHLQNQNRRWLERREQTATTSNPLTADSWSDEET